ncbi:hypothetical protein Glove_123g74 [Diversispora epigaea]|uniref:DNA polymerase delta catalytic subunit n=1 Tax=Diversispora epigaea TaxID=1348612 RepID=A0A397IYT1_9GLOM|nr:hypothetical protein Glove_123g74 [Diversispora epigaea]
MKTHSTQVIRYGGGDGLEGAPSRSDIISKCDNGLTAILQQSLSNNQPIHFMPNDVSDVTEYVKNVSTYILRIYGTLINGQKARVNITGIRPFFDVAVPDENSLAKFKSNLIKILSKTLKSTSKFGIEVIKAYPIREYQTEKKPYIRITTWNHYDRYTLLKAVREAKMETASDDLNWQYYYRKIAREKRLPLSSWAEIRNYTYTLSRDKTLVLTWDIETYSLCGLGGLPVAKYEEDCVFMICMTIHWKDDPNPLMQLCLVDVETKPDSRWITIICGNQTNLLKAFALCWKLLTPDIQIGFNDSQYDWPFIVEKAEKLGILEWVFNHMSPESSNAEKIMKWKYRSSMIKVSEGYSYSKYLKIPGCVPIDVRPCFKKLYPTGEKSSLAFYLGECKLGSKADMPYHAMKKYYKDALNDSDSSSTGHLHEIANYCIIDAVSCQRLMIKRNVINEYREVSSIAFLSLFDAHYFAGGMKVQNLLGAVVWQRGIITSMITRKQTETGKYPGAYVFPPEKGLENKRPVTGLDFASLYPSLIMTYNLSPDKIILSRDEAISALKDGKKLHKIEFPFNDRDITAWSVKHQNQTEMKGLYPAILEELLGLENKRPVTGLDFASLYPSLIMTYNLSPDKIILSRDEAISALKDGKKLHKIEFPFNDRDITAWSVKHQNQTEMKGLYPAILEELLGLKLSIGLVKTETDPPVSVRSGFGLLNIQTEYLGSVSVYS